MGLWGEKPSGVAKQRFTGVHNASPLCYIQRLNETGGAKQEAPAHRSSSRQE